MALTRTALTPPSAGPLLAHTHTQWFYDSNKAVDGCRRRASDPGTRHLDWLEAQLGMLRRRRKQAHLIGHVPPTAGNYFARCACPALPVAFPLVMLHSADSG